jgi:molybdopterin converting factor small subunit
MATVILQHTFARRHTDGQTRISVTAASYHELVEALARRFPGFAEAVGNGVAVAIDGEIFQTPLLEAVKPDSEVHFMPMIGGG